MKWKTVKLGENCTKIGSGATPRGGDTVYVESGIALIRSQNVYNGYFTTEGLAHLNETHAEQLQGVTVETNDILLNITGDSVARSCRVPSEILPARVNQHVAIIRPRPEELVAQFVGYYLISPFMQATMLSLAGGGGTRKALTKEMIERFDVPRPPLPVQHRIASILSAYDDLIENNNRRIALLEKAARHLYEEWFVRLKFPGHERTRITDGVPKGWTRRTLAEVTTFLKRGITPQYADEEEGLVINQKCIRDGRIDMTMARHQSREFAPEKQVQVGDVLVNSTGEGTLGRIAQVAAARKNCTVDTHVTIVRPAPGLGISYFGMAVRSWEPRFSTMGRGATNQTELSPTTIGESAVTIPSKTLMEDFESVAGPISQQNSNLATQNDKLRTARDLLLPRLMTGDVTV